MLIDGGQWGVAELEGVTDLGELVGMTPWDLERFADVRSFERTARHEALRNYRCRWIAKRSGSVRLIEAPKPILAHVQRTLLRDIVGRVPPHPAAHGFVAGRSVVTAARLHVGADVVVRLDLEAFFATVPIGRVFDARTVVVDEGFRLNDSKTMVMSRSRSQRVLGVVVNERLNPSRRDVDMLRAELHEARTKGPTVANRRGIVDYRSHLQGRIEWVRQLNPDRAAKLLAGFDDIDWNR